MTEKDDKMTETTMAANHGIEGNVTTNDSKTNRDNDEICRDSNDKQIENDEAYFTSYSDLSVHRTMLEDRPRTLAYKSFIEQNPELFKGKVVMDVGAGTGILSFFAARAGAKKVYAVEASDFYIVCDKLAQLNGFSNVIEVIHSKVEDLTLSEHIKVDIIISEWMGFYLLHESMLDSVLFARDKWLKPEGIMVPSHAYINLAPVNMDQFCKEQFEFWNDVYGFDYSPLISKVKESYQHEPMITVIKQDALLAEHYILAELDLKTVVVKDIRNIQEKCSFEVDKSGLCHGFACWFDVKFSGHVKDVILSTGPDSESTHWKQTVMFLPQCIEVTSEEYISCRVEMKQSASNSRHYDISLEMLDPDEDDDDEPHPVPCECGANKCQLILAIMDKYEDDYPVIDGHEVIDCT